MSKKCMGTLLEGECGAMVCNQCYGNTLFFQKEQGAAPAVTPGPCLPPSSLEISQAEPFFLRAGAPWEGASHSASPLLPGRLQGAGTRLGPSWTGEHRSGGHFPGFRGAGRFHLQDKVPSSSTASETQNKAQEKGRPAHSHRDPVPSLKPTLSLACSLPTRETAALNRHFMATGWVVSKSTEKSIGNNAFRPLWMAYRRAE